MRADGLRGGFGIDDAAAFFDALLPSTGLDGSFFVIPFAWEDDVAGLPGVAFDEDFPAFGAIVLAAAGFAVAVAFDEGFVGEVGAALVAATFAGFFATATAFILPVLGDEAGFEAADFAEALFAGAFLAGAFLAGAFLAMAPLAGAILAGTAFAAFGAAALLFAAGAGDLAA